MSPAPGLLRRLRDLARHPSARTYPLGWRAVDGQPRLVTVTLGRGVPPGGWLTQPFPGDHVQVVPVGDKVAHDLDDDATCCCGPITEAVPRPDGTTGWLIAHRSLDGREQHEHARRPRRLRYPAPTVHLEPAPEDP